MSDHDHDHPHDPIGTDGEPPAAARARALEELLVEKGVIDREAVRRGIDWLVSRSPADGARLVARAWVDPAFKRAPARRRAGGCARARPEPGRVAGRGRARELRRRPPPGRLHALLVLPASAARSAAGLVQERSLSVACRLRPTRRARRVRRHARRRRRGARRRLDGRHPLFRDPATPCRHRRR